MTPCFVYRWGVDVDAINSHSKDAAGVVKTPWLPHYVRVRVDTSNGLSLIHI